MRQELRPGNRFPEMELPDHAGNRRRLSELPGGDPLLLQFARGYFCPKEREFLRRLAAFQSEVEVAYTRMVTVTTEPPEILRTPDSEPAGFLAVWPEGAKRPRHGRRIDARAIDLAGEAAWISFGTSGKLYQSNLVMYDRATGSLWPQALGQAVTGPLTGRRLEGVPTQIVSWAAFRAGFPDGQVLSRDTGFSRPYGRNPYVGYDAKGSTPFLFDGKVDPRLGAVERVLGLTVGGRHLAVPYARLAARAQGGLRVVDLDLAGRRCWWSGGRARPRRWTASRSPGRATWAPRPRSPGGSAAGC